MFTKENIGYRDKVLFMLIEEIAKNSIQEKLYANIIKNFLKKNILIYDTNSPVLTRESATIKLEQIKISDYIHYIREINTVFILHNENNFMTDFIVYLVKDLYDGFLPKNNSLNDLKNPSINNINSSSSSSMHLSLMNFNLSKNFFLFFSKFPLDKVNDLFYQFFIIIFN